MTASGVVHNSTRYVYTLVGLVIRYLDPGLGFRTALDCFMFSLNIVDLTTMTKQVVGYVSLHRDSQAAGCSKEFLQVLKNCSQ